MLILAPFGQATITERSLTLASTWVRQARYVTPVSTRFRQAQWIVFSLFSSPHSPRRSGPHWPPRLRPRVLGQIAVFPKTSRQPTCLRGDVVMFRRQIAHVAVSADLLQRELPRLYGLLSPEPLHVQVSHSPRSNSVVHAEVCGTVREYLYSCASPLERAMTCCVEQLNSMGRSPYCSNAPVVLRRDSEPAQSESPNTTYFSGTSCAW